MKLNTTNTKRVADKRYSPALTEAGTKRRGMSLGFGDISY